MSERHLGWKAAVAVVGLLAAAGGGMVVASSLRDQPSDASPAPSDGSEPAADLSPAEQGDALAEQILSRERVKPTEALAEHTGTFDGEDGPQAAVAAVLEVHAGADSTLVTWRLRAEGTAVRVPAGTFQDALLSTGASGTDGVLLETGDEIVRPYRRDQAGTKGCLCSEPPTTVDRDGQDLAGLYPPIPGDVDRVDVRIPGFETFEDVVVVRPGQGGDDQVTGTADIPVLGTFRLQHDDVENRPSALGAVHGLRRVPGGTALYLSMGYPADSEGSLAFELSPQSSFDSSNASPREPFLVDALGRREYTTLVDRDGDCLCSAAVERRDAAGSDGSEADAFGKLFVFTAVLPELPLEVTSIDIGVGDAVVRGVPVSSGPMAPTAEGEGPVRLGRGWPSVDLEGIATAAPAVFPLTSRVTDLAGEVSTVEEPGTVSVELATDVLFAVDSAVLSPEARGRLEAAAAVVEARASGEVTIVGHTDSTGADDHNDQLSLARAQSVQAALEPLLTAGGVTLRAEGRGKREPIADNGTDEGRAANRRVVVTFSPK
jgi:outer membrane protein OmpA-like peptidoglycan-associated protein